MRADAPSPTAPGTVRRAGPRDRDGLYDVCLRTGDRGGDASDLFADPELLGHVYAGPYLALEPSLAFVVEDDDGVGGYALGALDTLAFEAACEETWWPPLRARYPIADGAPERPGHDEFTVHLLHRPPTTAGDFLASFPSHLHIDLLPRMQGRGWGRRLLDVLFDALVDAGSPGVHLRVAVANERAIAFYEHLGFATLVDDGYVRTMTLALPIR